MSERIPSNQAYLVVFRAYLASDGKTPATGKTIAITISKNGATSFSNPAAGATNATEMASGFYKFTLAAGDVDTLGPLAWRGTHADINDAGDKLTVERRFFGTVVDDAANTASSFETDRTETADDHWVWAWLRFTSGSLLGQTRRVVSYNGTTKFITTQAFTAEPSAGDTFELTNG